MRGICIDATELNAPVLKEGETYILEPPRNHYNTPAYHLPEIKALHPNKDCDFIANRFVPIQDDSVEEVVKEEELELMG